MYVIHITRKKQLKTKEEIKLICEEYCDEVEISYDAVCCLVNQKYLQDLKKRTVCHGWVIDKIKRKHFLLYIEFICPFI